MLPSWTEKASPAAFMSSTRLGKRARSSAVTPVSPMAPKSNVRPDAGVGPDCVEVAPAAGARELARRATPSPNENNHRLVTTGSNHRRGRARQEFRGGPWDRTRPQQEAGGYPVSPVRVGPARPEVSAAPGARTGVEGSGWGSPAPSGWRRRR